MTPSVLSLPLPTPKNRTSDPRLRRDDIPTTLPGVNGPDDAQNTKSPGVHTLQATVPPCGSTVPSAKLPRRGGDSLVAEAPKTLFDRLGSALRSSAHPQKCAAVPWPAAMGIRNETCDDCFPGCASGAYQRPTDTRPAAGDRRRPGRGPHEPREHAFFAHQTQSGLLIGRPENRGRWMLPPCDLRSRLSLDRSIVP